MSIVYGGTVVKYDECRMAFFLAVFMRMCCDFPYVFMRIVIVGARFLKKTLIYVYRRMFAGGLVCHSFFLRQSVFGYKQRNFVRFESAPSRSWNIMLSAAVIKWS